MMQEFEEKKNQRPNSARSFKNMWNLSKEKVVIRYHRNETRPSAVIWYTHKSTHYYCITNAGVFRNSVDGILGKISEILRDCKGFSITSLILAGTQTPRTSGQESKNAFQIVEWLSLKIRVWQSLKVPCLWDREAPGISSNVKQATRMDFYSGKLANFNRSVSTRWLNLV